MMFRSIPFAAAPAALLLATLPGANAHARVSDIRVPGPAHIAACGQASSDTVTRDPTGPIEGQEPVNQGCELQLCRGLLFEDQAATAASTVNVAPGGNVTFNVECTIPHGGPANVALIDTTTGGSGTVIGDFLKQFDSFCPTDSVPPPDQTTLQVTLPDEATIAGRCSKPGDCVTQLFWATPDLSQNYYYCKDTVISGDAAASVLAKTRGKAPARRPPPKKGPPKKEPVRASTSVKASATRAPATKSVASSSAATKSVASSSAATKSVASSSTKSAASSSAASSSAASSSAASSASTPEEEASTDAPAALPTLPPTTPFTDLLPTLLTPLLPTETFPSDVSETDIPADAADSTEEVTDGAALPEESAVDDTAIVDEPTAIDETDPAAETGAEDAEPAVETGAEDTAAATDIEEADPVEETGAEDTAAATDIEEADPAEETGAEDAATATDVEESGAAVETGAEDTAAATDAEEIDPAGETGVDDIATPTDAVEAATPTGSSPPAASNDKSKGRETLNKFIDFFGKILSKPSQGATTPAGQPVAAKRWSKDW